MGRENEQLNEVIDAREMKNRSIMIVSQADELPEKMDLNQMINYSAETIVGLMNPFYILPLNGDDEDMLNGMFLHLEEVVEAFSVKIGKDLVHYEVGDIVVYLHFLPKQDIAEGKLASENRLDYMDKVVLAYSQGYKFLKAVLESDYDSDESPYKGKIDPEKAKFMKAKLDNAKAFFGVTGKKMAEQVIDFFGFYELDRVGPDSENEEETVYIGLTHDQLEKKLNQPLAIIRAKLNVWEEKLQRLKGVVQSRINSQSQTERP